MILSCGKNLPLGAGIGRISHEFLNLWYNETYGGNPDIWLKKLHSSIKNLLENQEI